MQLWLAIWEYVPGVHSVVAEAPATSTKVPAGANLQSLWPCWFVKRPRVQLRHAPSPAPLYVPSGHNEHAAAPSASLDSPAGHAVQDGSPAELKVPMGQSVHSRLAISEDRPAGQSVGSEARVTLTYVPAGASLQSLWPSWSVKRPRVQLRHAPSPAPL